MMGLIAGAGEKEINIPVGYLEAENFGEVHDPIHAKVVIFQQEEKIVLISLELTSIQSAEVEQIRAAVKETLNVKRKNIWVCVTHSFSSPHLLANDQLKSADKIKQKSMYWDNLLDAVLSAAKEANESLRPAMMKIGSGQCEIVANRDVELKDGWWVGTNGNGPTDRTVTVLSLEDQEGSVIAVITHFSMQSSVMDQAELSDGKKPVTSDVVGYACSEVERKLGGVAIYLIGAAGDQAPIEKAVTDTFVDGKRIRTDLHEQGFTICENLGDELANVIIKTKKNAVLMEDTSPMKMETHLIALPAKQMGGDIHTLTPNRNFKYFPEGENQTEIEAFCIGNLVLLGVKPELNCLTAKWIRKNSEFNWTLVCTMVNGGAKYMADTASYEKRCYEAINSPWGQGAAEILSEESVRFLNDLF